MVVEVHAAMQCAIDNWGNLLIATGGTLKPNKCFFHLNDFQEWTRCGGWQYVGHHKDETAAVFAPFLRIPSSTWRSDRIKSD